MPGEPAMLTGIEDMEQAIDTLVDAAPDAIQLSVGQADLLQRHPGRDKPALVLRTDTPNIYAPEAPAEAWSFMIDDPVGHAVRLDAACVVVNLLDVPGQDGLRRDCLEAISHLRAECDRAGDAADGRAARVRARRGRRLRSRAATSTASAASSARRSSSAPTSSRPTRPTTSPTTTASSPVARVPLLRARRRPRHRPGDPRAHARRARAGRGGHRLRPQRDPARQPGGDDRAR